MTNLFSAYSTITTITDSVQIPVVDPSTNQTKITNFAAIKEAIGSLGTGATGPQGPVGAKGIQGSSGINGTTGATGYPGSTGSTGPIGATGPQGTSINIIGSVATANTSTLTLADPSPNRGDGFISLDTKHLWVWDGSNWNDAGNVLGPQGATGVGATGIQGIQGATGSTGPQGSTGVSNVPGATGSTGPAGATGATGPMGPIGTTTPATTTTIGGLIVGHNLVIDTSTGLLSVLSAIPGDTPPNDNPQQGDLWWDSIIGRGFIYYNEAWVEYSPQSPPGAATTSSLGLVQIGSGITVSNGLISVTPTVIQSTTQPAASTSTIWFNPGSNISYIYNGSSWINLDAGSLAQYVPIGTLAAIISTSTSWTQFQANFAAVYGS